MSNQASRHGPLGLPLYPTGFAVEELHLDGGPMFWEEVQRLSSGEALAGFVTDHLEAPAAPRVCVILGPPDATAARAAAALRTARTLGRRGRRVAVLAGDDLSPDLTRWAGRAEVEGWIDVVRYGSSPSAAAAALPWAAPGGLLLGVGSYQPSRATGDEVRALVAILLEQVDTVLVSASTGDRGAVWATVPSLRVLCWDQAALDSSLCEVMIRDVGQLGDPPAAALVFAAARAAPAARPEPQPRASRRRGGVLVVLAVLAVIAGVWWFGTQRRPHPDAVAGKTVAPDSRSLQQDIHDDLQSSAIIADSTTSLRVDSMSAAAAESLAIEVAPVDALPAPTGDPFAGPVGAAGWCLHVYSFDDSLLALEEVSNMAGKGVVGLIHAEDSGTRHLFRIFAGNFPSRAAAGAAQTELFARLRTDWAQPVAADRLR
ncbi:MAG: SPOR domain-containing protein [Candidatus Latescibacteria bacterium]|nr:SPOR domain-containing protein [Candidatus Latescibacterota bacterium]